MKTPQRTPARATNRTRRKRSDTSSQPTPRLTGNRRCDRGRRHVRAGRLRTHPHVRAGPRRRVRTAGKRPVVQLLPRRAASWDEPRGDRRGLPRRWNRHAKRLRGRAGVPVRLVQTGMGPERAHRHHRFCP
ncbi:hypothetical protein ACFPRL_11035 [Pseudoclavibacter helvolus]